MGSDAILGGVEWQFRRLKKVAKEQANAVKAGRDPKDVNVHIDLKGHTLGSCPILYFSLALFFLLLFFIQQSTAQHSTAQALAQARCADINLTVSQLLPDA